MNATRTNEANFELRDARTTQTLTRREAMRTKVAGVGVVVSDERRGCRRVTGGVNCAKEI